MSCERIAESMQSSGKFSRVCFCLEVLPTDQVPFLQSTAPFIFLVCALSLTLCVLSNFGCLGHSSLFNNNSGPSNHCPFCILSIDALWLPKSDRFLSVGQCLQTIPVSYVISAILLTQLETKAFHTFLGLQI